MKVLIITGGYSSERKVSLTSAREVKKALIKNKFKAKIYDLKNGYLPIKKLAKDFDVLFPVLHGEEGEGGILHKFLSKIDKPIVGTRNYKGMEEGWYKIPFKKYCDKNHIETPRWKIVKNKADVVKFGFPSVLKSSNGGSSKEVIMLNSEKDLNKNFTKKLLTLKNIFVEEKINGVEETVGILNGKAMPIIEIIPPVGEWFSYKYKYSGETKEIPNAPSIKPATRKKLQEIALTIHKHFNLGTYSRIDFMVINEVPYAIELNTIPGLTAESLFPKGAKAAGIDFKTFIKTLVSSAE